MKVTTQQIGLVVMVIALLLIIYLLFGGSLFSTVGGSGCEKQPMLNQNGVQFATLQDVNDYYGYVMTKSDFQGIGITQEDSGVYETICPEVLGGSQ